MQEIIYDNFEWSSKDNNKFNETKFENKRLFRKPTDAREIYTDGGSRMITCENGKQIRIGAWAFYDTVIDLVTGDFYESGTNNQMELTAVIEALKHLDSIGFPKDSWVIINLDSEYVRMGILFWVKKWILNDWSRVNKNGEKEEIKNRDLWETLYSLSKERKIYWNHVSGHSGNEGNDKVDIECTTIILEKEKEIKENNRG